MAFEVETARAEHVLTRSELRATRAELASVKRRLEDLQRSLSSSRALATAAAGAAQPGPGGAAQSGYGWPFPTNAAASAPGSPHPFFTAPVLQPSAAVSTRGSSSGGSAAVTDPFAADEDGLARLAAICRLARVLPSQRRSRTGSQASNACMSRDFPCSASVSSAASVPASGRGPGREACSSSSGAPINLLSTAPSTPPRESSAPLEAPNPSSSACTVPAPLQPRAAVRNNAVCVHPASPPPAPPAKASPSPAGSRAVSGAAREPQNDVPVGGSTSQALQAAGSEGTSGDCTAPTLDLHERIRRFNMPARISGKLAAHAQMEHLGVMNEFYDKVAALECASDFSGTFNESSAPMLRVAEATGTASGPVYVPAPVHLSFRGEKEAPAFKCCFDASRHLAGKLAAHAHLEKFLDPYPVEKPEFTAHDAAILRQASQRGER